MTREKYLVIRKGSITVYLTLVMLLIFTILFTFLEGARYQGQIVNARMVSEAAIESVFAEYQRSLLERYDIFAIDGAYCDSEFEIGNVDKRFVQNLIMNSGSGAFSFSNMAGAVTDYKLLTDDMAEAYVSMAADYMKQELVVDMAQSAISTLATSTDDTSLSIDKSMKSLEESQDALSSESNYTEEESTAITEYEKQEAANVSSDDKNIINKVLSMRSVGILPLVIENVSDISSKAVNLNDAPSVRTLGSGTHMDDRDVNTIDNAVFAAYLADKFGNYRNVKENTALDYELEYIYSGKESDRDNLEAVAESLVAIREVVNYAADIKDQAKMQKARIIAISIAGLLATPYLISVIQMAVIGAWAFMESIEDVKQLMAGEKVTGIEGYENVRLSYEDYIKILLLIKSNRNRIYRSLDLIEQNIRLEDSYANFKIDNLIVGVSWDSCLTSDRKFAGLLATYNPFGASYELTSSGYYTYE